MSIKIKTAHARNWFYGNICTKKCYADIEKQKHCYDKMAEMIKGNEDYFITHNTFVKTIRQKHKEVCDISDELFNHNESDFWHRKL
ncbi:MAG: hypothetical protein AAB575_03375 [Patescibacteria group bacterium]